MKAILRLLVPLFQSSQLRRASACIWLLALVSNCGDHRAIAESLESIQRLFLTLLGDSNGLTLLTPQTSFCCSFLWVHQLRMKQAGN